MLSIQAFDDGRMGGFLSNMPRIIHDGPVVCGDVMTHIRHSRAHRTTRCARTALRTLMPVLHRLFLRTRLRVRNPHLFIESACASRRVCSRLVVLLRAASTGVSEGFLILMWCHFALLVYFSACLRCVACVDSYDGGSTLLLPFFSCRAVKVG